MDERVIWKVTVKQSYNSIEFTFRFVENALLFAKMATEHSNDIKVSIETVVCTNEEDEE